MPSEGFWSRQTTRGIRAACEALFPENDLGAPDWQSTDMVARMRAFLDALPAEHRLLHHALFLAVELGCVVLVLGFRRFSSMTPARRAEVVRRWRRSRFQLFRVLGDALKATTTMIYLSHPKAIAYLEAYKTCERPGDTLTFPVRRDALARVRTE